MIGQAAKANAEVAKQALDWYMGEYEKQKPRQEQLDKISSDLAEQQIDTSRFNTEMARDQWDRYQAVGIPAEDAMYRDAQTYDSVDKQAQAAGQAATDVDSAMQSAADLKRRTLARMGVNPADGAALQMERDAATQGALAKASAMTSARTRIKDMGIMLRKDAASFAKGMPSTAAQTYGVAGAAGAGATGAIQGAIASANQSTQTAGQGFGTAIQGNSSAGSILNGGFGNAVSAANASNAAVGTWASVADRIGSAYAAKSADKNAG